MIKFNKYHIVDTATKIKARVFYSLSNDGKGKKTVFISERDYAGNLSKILNDAQNNTDITTDYIDHDYIIIPESSDLFAAAESAAEKRLGRKRQNYDNA